LQSLNSQGGQFVIGPGGLLIRSTGVAALVAGDRSARYRLQTVVDPLALIRERYSGLFDESGGSFHLRAPESEIEPAVPFHITTTRPLSADAVIHPMISRAALDRITHFVPLHDIGYFGDPRTFFEAAQRNAFEQSCDGVISQRTVAGTNIIFAAQYKF
jgi:hypothetical protein